MHSRCTHIQRQLFKKLPLILLGLLPNLSVWAQTASFPEEGPFHDAWMEMNFYHQGKKGFSSEIINDSFFLSPDGASSPESEFQAFSKAMKDYNTETLCRYPARTTLFRKSIKEFQNVPQPDCSSYPRHIDPDKVTGVSLIFASGYFESPASYFGHTMLKFDTNDTDVNEFFFDSSLNYGAEVTDATGNPMYIIKGLTGGYTASFQRNNDFINTHNYTNKDMRDVWEYPLNLTSEQKAFLVEFSSELRQARFKYYFFNDNCAHRMARLIEMTTGQRLVKTDGPWLLPIDVIQSLSEPETGKLSPISSEIRSPSLKSKARQDFLKLSSQEKDAVKTYLRSSITVQQTLAPELSDDALRVTRSQYDLELAKLTTKAKDADKLKDLQKHRHILLMERLKRSPSSSSEHNTFAHKTGSTPATLNHPGALQIGYIAKPGNDAFNLRFQAANNDLLNKPLEGQEASKFIMGALEVDLNQDKMDLRSFTAFDIASFNTNPIPRGFLSDLSWSIQAEYAPRNLICDSCTTGFIDAKVGKAIRPSSNIMLYSLWGGQVNHKQTRHNDTLMLRSENGILANLSSINRINLELNAEASPTSGNPLYLLAAETAYDIAPQTDIRARFEHDFDKSALLVRFSFYLN